MTKLVYKEGRPHFSNLTKRYYPTNAAAFEDSVREGGGADIDFNLYFVHRDEPSEIAFSQVRRKLTLEPATGITPRLAWGVAHIGTNMCSWTTSQSFPVSSAPLCTSPIKVQRSLK